MNKHVEMIADYIVVPYSGYRYDDNHGILTRCKDCEYWNDGNIAKDYCPMKLKRKPKADDYCSRAVRKK